MENCSLIACCGLEFGHESNGLCSTVETGLVNKSSNLYDYIGHLSSPFGMTVEQCLLGVGFVRGQHWMFHVVASAYTEQTVMPTKCIIKKSLNLGFFLGNLGK